MRILPALALVALLAGCADDAPAPADASEPEVEAVAEVAPDPGMAPGTDDPPVGEDSVDDDVSDVPVFEEPTYRIVSAEAGDRACYLELEPGEGGPPETYLADFEICYAIEDDGLTGRLVTFETETISILADSCEGDIDCPDRDEVDAIMNLTILD